MMINLSYQYRLRNLLIRSKFKRWAFPSLCALPYLYSLLWLTSKGLYWLVQVLIAPIIMTLLLFGLAYILASIEFRR